MTHGQRIGRRLRKAREKRGLSRRAAGALIEMDQTSIYRWERGVNQPDWDSLWKMCRVYGVRVGSVVDPERPVRAAKKQPIAA